MKFRNIIAAIALIASIALVSCSDSDSFSVEGRIEGVNAQSVTLTYYAVGGLKSTTLSANGGSFSFSGKTAHPSLAVLTVAPENVRIATFVVQNGDRITIDASLDDPLVTTIKGNSASEETSGWVKKNAETLKSRNEVKINQAVAEYVRKNPSKLSSTAILTGFFIPEGNEAMADSLFSMLNREVRQTEMTRAFNTVIASYLGMQTKAPVPYLSLYERRDSIVHINMLRHSLTLLCIVDDSRHSRDSIVPHLRELTDSFPKRRLLAVEISTAPDSASWRTSIGRDSVVWPQMWALGSVSAEPLRKLNIVRVPYFIVSDSTGKPIYRGPSISNARSVIEHRL